MPLQRQVTEIGFSPSSGLLLKKSLPQFKYFFIIFPLYSPQTLHLIKPFEISFSINLLINNKKPLPLD